MGVTSRVLFVLLMFVLPAVGAVNCRMGSGYDFHRGCNPTLHETTLPSGLKLLAPCQCDWELVANDNATTMVQLAAFGLPAGAIPIVRNASGSTQLFQVGAGATLHVQSAWASNYNYDTNAANNATATPACNGKVWVEGIQSDEVASSTLSIALTDTTTCPTVADATNFQPSSALTGTNAVLLDNEWVIFAGKTGNQLTPCTRGAHGTTAATHLVNIGVREWKERRLVDIWAAAVLNACTDSECTASKTPCACCTGNGTSTCTGAAAAVPSTSSVPVIDIPLVEGGVVMCTLAGSSAAKCHVACGFNGYTIGP